MTLKESTCTIYN